MSTRAMLNRTSKKKRDTMLCWSNTNGNGVTQATAPSSLNINGTGSAFVVWNATARDATDSSTGNNFPAYESGRTSTTCFMRGLKENIRVQTSTGLPWLWRRICFTYKDRAIFDQINGVGTGGPVQNYVSFIEASNGYGRLAFNQTLNNQAPTIAFQQARLFRGEQGQDWNDPMTAPLDTRRITVKYDKYTRISSGNSTGILRDYKRWYPMNRNLVYDDDEAGNTEAFSSFSVADKAGMGNYYVCDIIQPGYGGTTSDILSMSFEASLYWHEK